MTLDDEAYALIVKHYHKPSYRQITDYNEVVANKTTTTLDGDTIYVFPAPGQTIYLREDGYAVTIGNQKVDPVNDNYYYKWNLDPNVEEDTAFEYVTRYEWKNTSLPHLPPIEDEEE